MESTASGPANTLRGRGQNSGGRLIHRIIKEEGNVHYEVLEKEDLVAP